MKKKILVFLVGLLFLSAAAYTQNGNGENPNEITKATDTSAETKKSDTNSVGDAPVSDAPVYIGQPTPEPEEFFPSDTETPSEETEESIRTKLDENRRNYITYKTLQYTSVGVAALGLLMVILDAFIETGSEYPYTPIPSESNPNPTAVTTAFGNLSIAGAVVTAVGAGASIGFQFPYRKYRNRQYILENRLHDLEKLNETETGLEEIIKEVIVD